MNNNIYLDVRSSSTSRMSALETGDDNELSTCMLYKGIE